MRAIARIISERLAAQGLPLCGIVSSRQWLAIEATAPPWLDFAPWASTLVLALHVGDSLWRRVADEVRRGAANAFDDVSRFILQGVAAEIQACGIRAESLCVADEPARAWPLIRLARVAGIARPGRHGLLLHPIYGSWIAVRGVLLVAADWSSPRHADLPWPCAGCAAPCAALCPATAIGTDGLLVDRCTAHRRGTSECQFRCAARSACPVGREYMYSREQIEYHMARSLRSIRECPPVGQEADSIRR